jgi:hypothetical protein
VVVAGHVARSIRWSHFFSERDLASERLIDALRSAMGRCQRMPANG